MKPMMFMGQEFSDRAALTKAYPAFSGDDSVRAIQAGAADVMAVEVHCWRAKNRAYLKAREAARKSEFSKRMSKMADQRKRRRA